MHYVDFYLLPVPATNIDAYREMASKAGAIWKEHGALAYKECRIEDGAIEGTVPFAKVMATTGNETVVAAYVLFKDRAHRDEVNAKVMQDPRLKDACDAENMPFDFKRMAYGGFTTLVDL